MAVSDQPISIAYATDGISTNYAFPYYFRAFADLVVTFKDVNGVVTTKVLNTDYHVVASADPKLNVYSSGGGVFLVAPLSPGGQVRITRKTPRTQPAVYGVNDPFPAASHEAALDNLELQLQDALKAIGCLGIADGPPTSGSFSIGDWLKDANPVPGGTMGWIYLGAWYSWGQISG